MFYQKQCLKESMFRFSIVLFVATYFLQGCCANGFELLIQNDLEYYETLDYDLERTIGASQPMSRRKRDASYPQTEESSVGTKGFKLSFFAFGQHFQLQLKRDFSIFHNDIKIQFGHSQHVKLSHDTMNLYDGPVVTSSSSLKGYCFGSISNGVFDGQILTQEGTYYVAKMSTNSTNALNKTGHSLILNDSFVYILPSSSIASPQNEPLKTSKPSQDFNFNSSSLKTDEILPLEQGENFALFR